MEKQDSIMKVGYVAPMSIAAVNGGIRTQATFTIKHIKNHGVQPVLLSPWDDIGLQKLDLVHVFGASIENTGIINQLHALKIPFVLSPVFYSTRSASIIKRAIKIEKIGAIVGKGIRSDFSIKADLCHKADKILPNTTEELKLIEMGFSIPSKKLSVVPNGVENRFANASPDLFIEKYGLQDFILFTGQAGAERKNVLKLIEAASDIETPLVIIGSFYEDEYGKECISKANKSTNAILVDTLEHESDLLASAYAACKVFVLPSLYETPGIAALEAALTGANIVITKHGGTKDYFETYAEYIDPNSASSIRESLKNALDKPKSVHLKKHILNSFTWKNVAEQTFEQYKNVVA